MSSELESPVEKDSPSPPKSTGNHGPSLLRAAGLIAAVTILSKVLGALRDWQIMNVYGASLASDAYFAAVQLPSFAIVLLGGLGGPFHTATVAVFSRLMKDSEKADEQAQKLASGFITLTGLGFLLMSVLCFTAAHPIMKLILQDADAALIDNAAAQLQIMSPVLFFGGLIGIFYGILNVFHSFFWPSLSPAALSIVMSIALLLDPNDKTGHLLAWSTLAGTVVQFLIQLPEFFKRGFTLKPSLDWNNPVVSAQVKEIGMILFPAIVGTTIGQLTTYVDMFFTQYLQEGGWTAIVMGNRLFQLPIGVLQTAFLVPIFPRFTRYVADEAWDDLRQNFKLGIVSLWFISIPIMIGILVYIEPLVKLVFEHGEFDAHDTHMVSQALVFLSWSMLPYFARDTLTRVFYAFGDSRTPLMVGAIAIVLKGFLDWLWVVHYDFGVGGITFSTTLITVINMTLLGIFSKKHIPTLGARQMVSPLIKLTLAGGLMALCMIVADPLLHQLLQQFQLLPGTNRSALAEVGLILVSGGAGLCAYVACALLLKVEEVHYLMVRLKLKKAH